MYPNQRKTLAYGLIVKVDGVKVDGACAYAGAAKKAVRRRAVDAAAIFHIMASGDSKRGLITHCERIAS